MKKIVMLLALAAMLIPAAAFAAHTTYHGCAPCHTPHNAAGIDDDKVDVPLWSGQATSTVFQLYDSETLDTEPEQPTGSSALCLSCHDGTAQHTWVGTREDTNGDGIPDTWLIDTDGDGIGDTVPPEDGSIPPGATPAESNFGNDLRHSHPVSIDYLVVEGDDDFVAAADVSPGYLRGKNGVRRVECASCHEVHDDPANAANGDADQGLRDGHLYEDAFGGGALCQECHIK